MSAGGSSLCFSSCVVNSAPSAAERILSCTKLRVTVSALNDDGAAIAPLVIVERSMESLVYRQCRKQLGDLWGLSCHRALVHVAVHGNGGQRQQDSDRVVDGSAHDSPEICTPSIAQLPSPMCCAHLRGNYSIERTFAPPDAVHRYACFARASIGTEPPRERSGQGGV